MKLKDINFPVYRKYKNNKSYFKIINLRLFEEIQIMGSKKKIQLIEAKMYPEICFINDLLMNYFEMAEELSEQEYLKMKG